MRKRRAKAAAIRYEQLRREQEARMADWPEETKDWVRYYSQWDLPR